MALCTSCSAPLPANTGLCSYCGTRNDLDVLAARRFDQGHEASSRACPDCRLKLETIRLDEGGKFAVERCATCFGLFFDPGEVQAYLDATVPPVYVVNYQELVNINRERSSQGQPVRYRKCPECGQIMNRVNFGTRSGVVIDQCKSHGVWFDNGELIHIMEWKRAGGQILAEQRRQARQEEAARAAKVRVALPVEEPMSLGGEAENSLVDSALKLLGFIFR